MPPPVTSGQKWVYGIDGKHLHRQGVVLIHRNLSAKENLWWSFHPSESYSAVEADLQILTKLISASGGNFPVGAISDWKGAIVTAISGYLGPIPHQRCLTHVVNLAKRLLPENSPYEATRQLRLIAKELLRIEAKEEMVAWMWELKLWEQKYGLMLKEKTQGINTQRTWWYTHGNLRRGFRLLTVNQGPLFVYLDYPTIPKSNNSLEGLNGQATQKLGNHRGMKIPQQVSFLSWWLTFQKVKNNEDLKNLWGLWKEEFFRRLSTRKPT